MARSTFKVLFYVNGSKEKNGIVPIMGRVTINGTVTQFSCKLVYEGELYSEEHKRKFKTERAGFQVVKDPRDKSKLVLAINGQLIGEWFKEQFNRLFSSIRRTVEPYRKGKGMGL